VCKAAALDDATNDLTGVGTTEQLLAPA